MSIKIGTIKANNNGGDGIRIVGSSDISFGDVEAVGNGGAGFNVISSDAISVLREIGAPEVAGPKEVAELLRELQEIEVERREDFVRHNSFIQRLATAAGDVTQFMANLVTLAGEPHVHTIIARLMG